MSGDARVSLGARLLARLGHGLAHDPGLPWQVADVGVVLGGHPRVRVPAALDLWRSGVVPQIALVGGQLVDGRPHEVVRGEQTLGRLGVPLDDVVCLETEALGTLDEARVVLQAAREHGWRKVVVVTSPYHRWRSTLQFSAVFARASVEVHVVVTPYDDWSADGWWADVRQRRLVMQELAKYAAWRTGLRRLTRPGDRAATGW